MVGIRRPRNNFYYFSLIFFFFLFNVDKRPARNNSKTFRVFAFLFFLVKIIKNKNFCSNLICPVNYIIQRNESNDENVLTSLKTPN